MNSESKYLYYSECFQQDTNCDTSGANLKRQEYLEPRFITIHSTTTSSATATSTVTNVQAAKQTILFKSQNGCFPWQIVSSSLSLTKC